MQHKIISNLSEKKAITLSSNLNISEQVMMNIVKYFKYIGINSVQTAYFCKYNRSENDIKYVEIIAETEERTNLFTGMFKNKNIGSTDIILVENSEVLCSRGYLMPPLSKQSGFLEYNNIKIPFKISSEMFALSKLRDTQSCIVIPVFENTTIVGSLNIAFSENLTEKHIEKFELIDVQECINKHGFKFRFYGDSLLGLKDLKNNKNLTSVLRWGGRPVIGRLIRAFVKSRISSVADEQEKTLEKMLHILSLQESYENKLLHYTSMNDQYTAAHSSSVAHLSELLWNELLKERSANEVIKLICDELGLIGIDMNKYSKEIQLKIIKEIVSDFTYIYIQHDSGKIKVDKKYFKSIHPFVIKKYYPENPQIKAADNEYSEEMRKHAEYSMSNGYSGIYMPLIEILERIVGVVSIGHQLSFDRKNKSGKEDEYLTLLPEKGREDKPSITWNMSLFNQVVHLADSYHAVFSSRFYSQGRSLKDMTEEILRGTFTNYRLDVVNAFVNVLKNKSLKVEDMVLEKLHKESFEICTSLDPAINSWGKYLAVIEAIGSICTEYDIVGQDNPTFKDRFKKLEQNALVVLEKQRQDCTIPIPKAIIDLIKATSDMQSKIKWLREIFSSMSENPIIFLETYYAEAIAPEERIKLRLMNNMIKQLELGIFNGDLIKSKVQILQELNEAKLYENKSYRIVEVIDYIQPPIQSTLS